MANFYMNLSRAGSGYSGTTGDPYSWTDYVSLRLGPTFSNDDTIYVKGNVSTGEYELSPGADWIVFDKWDTSHPNGSDDAWRLELSYAGGISTDFYGVIFKRGVIYHYGTNEIVVGASGGGHNFQNFLLYADTADIGIGNRDNSILRGCSLRTPGVFSSYLNTTILDSSIECASVTIAGRGGSLTSTNCSYSPGSVGGSLTSCQLNWPAGVAWPAYNAPAAAFDNIVLGATLSAPAQPGFGAPSYTGYNTGPWGNARTGISGFYFPVSDHSVNFHAGANGTLTGDDAQTVPDGNDATPVTAVPDIGYEFDGWTGDVTSSDNPLTVTNVTGDLNITANFTIKQYNVTFIEGADGSITGDKNQVIDHGSDCTAVEAVPDYGFSFDGWTGDITSSDNPLTVTNVTDDLNITANSAALIAPTITSQNDFPYYFIGDSFIINILQLDVYDPDSVFPDDFTLTILDDPRYTQTRIDNHSYTILADNSLQALSIPLKVNDSIRDSDIFSFLAYPTKQAGSGNIVIKPTRKPNKLVLGRRFLFSAVWDKLHGNE